MVLAQPKVRRIGQRSGGDVVATQVDPFAVLDRQRPPLGATDDFRISRFLRDMRGDTGLAQLGDELGAMLQPTGRSGEWRWIMSSAARRSACPSAWVRSPCTIRPERLSIRAWPMTHSIAPAPGTSCKAGHPGRRSRHRRHSSASCPGNRPLHCGSGGSGRASRRFRVRSAWIALRGDIGSGRGAGVVIRRSAAGGRLTTLHRCPSLHQGAVAAKCSSYRSGATSRCARIAAITSRDMSVVSSLSRVLANTLGTPALALLQDFVSHTEKFVSRYNQVASSPTGWRTPIRRRTGQFWSHVG